MDRRSFFKGIGVISAGIVVAPVVAAEALKEPPSIVFDNGDIVVYIRNGVQYSLDSPEKILKLWKETGIFIIKPYMPSKGTLTREAFDKYGITFKEAKDD